MAVWRKLGLDLAYATHGRTRLGTEVDPHLSATTPQRAEVVLVDRLPGWGLLLMRAGPNEALAMLAAQPLWILAIGPLFAALAGIGFKEFFCFQRPEAVGLTLLLPIALLGRLVGIINTSLCAALLITAGLLMVLLALRKFGMEAAADVGDKSVFAYLDSQRPASTQ